jgi:hypothetical protein
VSAVQPRGSVGRFDLGRRRAALVACFRRLTQHRLPTWLAASIALLGGVLLTLQRPHVRATVPLSRVQLGVSQPLRFRDVLTSAITTLQFSHFERLDVGTQECSSTTGKAVATLIIPKGGLKTLTIGTGKWSLETMKRDEPSRGAFRLVLQESSTVSDVRVETVAGLTGTLKVEHCFGNERDGELTLGENLLVQMGPRKNEGLGIYASYGDPLSVPLFSDVCLDELSGVVESEWRFQRKYWETCALSSNTELREFGLQASAGCSPPELPVLREEKGGIRLRHLRFDSKRIEAEVRWPKQTEWAAELDSACTFTFWEPVVAWFK